MAERIEYSYVNEDSIYDLLKCPVGQDPLIDPVYLPCGCGQVFSRANITTWIRRSPSQSAPCAKCRGGPFKETDLRPANDPTLRRLLAGLQVYCGHRRTGCEWIGARGDLVEHMPYCDFEQIPCPFAGDDYGVKLCLLRPSRISLSAHIKNCRFRAASELLRSQQAEISDLRRENGALRTATDIWSQTALVKTMELEKAQKELNEMGSCMTRIDKHLRASNTKLRRVLAIEDAMQNANQSDAEGIFEPASDEVLSIRVIKKPTTRRTTNGFGGSSSGQGLDAASSLPTPVPPRTVLPPTNPLRPGFGGGCPSWSLGGAPAAERPSSSSGATSQPATTSSFSATSMLPPPVAKRAKVDPRRYQEILRG
ncbi:Protein fam98b [Rhizophlyctis rosea]|nr:Protein fam98b [Rhizophlyctis rosea]